MDIQATMTEFQTLLGMTTVAITKIVKEKYQNENYRKSNRVNCREAKITRSSMIDTLIINELVNASFFARIISYSIATFPTKLPSNSSHGVAPPWMLV